MSNYQNVNVSSRMIRTIIWAAAGVVLVIVAMAFVMPWYKCMVTGDGRQG